MKHNILMYCDTPFQIMMCVHLKRTVLKEKNVDIIITNHINNWDNIYETIKLSNIFDNTYFMKAYELDYKNNEYAPFKVIGGTRLRQIHNVIKRKKIMEKLLPLDKIYDEFWITDILESTNLIYDTLVNENRDLKVVFFEEGPISVLCDQNHQFDIGCFWGVDVIRKIIYKVLGYRMLYGNFSCAFSSVMDIVDWKPYFSVMKIPPLKMDDEEYILELNKIWKYKSDDTFKNKVVFFEESFFLNGIENKDLEIISDICDVVGIENVIVKLHPRTRIDRFVKMGIPTNSDSSIPWELIALNNQENNSVLVAVSSGSLIHPQLYWGINQNSICLADCKEYSIEEINKEYYQEFIRLCKEKNLAKLPCCKDEFLNELKRWRK